VGHLIRWIRLIAVTETLQIYCVVCCVTAVMSQEATPRSFHGTDRGTCWPSENIAKPLHIQRVEEALKLDAVLAHVESLNKSSIHR